MSDGCSGVATMSLLARPRPHLEESVVGYVLRLFESNFISDPEVVIRGLFPAHTSFEQALLELFESGGRYALFGRSVRAIADNQQQHNFRDRQQVLQAHSRCCVGCLKELPIWRPEWELQFHVRCPRHKCDLLTRCPRCERVIRAWRPSLVQCYCGFDLRYSPLGEANSPDATTHERTLSDQIAVAAGFVLPLEVAPPGDDSPPEIFALSVGQLQDLIQTIGAYAQFGGIAKPRKVMLYGQIENERRLIAGAGNAISNWPLGYWEFLRNIDGSVEGETSRRSLLPYFLRELYGPMAGDGFAFLRKAYEEYLLANKEMVFNGRHRRSTSWLIENQRYIEPGPVQQSSGLSRRDIRNLIHEGRVKGIIRTLPSGRERLLLEKANISCVMKESETLDLAASAERLGIPEARVLQLIGAGVIEGRPPEPGKVWRIPEAALCDLVNSLATASCTGIRPQGSTPVPFALRYRLSVGSKGAAELVSDIRLGELSCWVVSSAPPLSFRDFFVDPSEVQIWRRSGDDHISVPEVAKTLGIKQEVAYHLVRSGRIASVDFGREGQRVSTSELRAFRNRYIWGREVARYLGMSPKATSDLMRRAGVSPCCGPNVDGGRQVLYERSALAVLPLPLAVRNAIGLIDRSN